MKLVDLMATLQVYELTKPIQHINITGIEMDSRAVEENNLFICIDGFTVDGHNFAEQAVQKGACAILAERPLDVSVPVMLVKDTKKAMAVLANTYYNQPTQSLRLFGVTGTNGKTSVTYLLESIYKTHEEKTGLIGTIQMKIGDETREVKNTTPDALALQRFFKEMVDEGVQTAFMEVSSHALSMGRTFGCDYDIAIYTNLSQDHLDYHDTMEDYLKAKTLLFTGLGNQYTTGRPKFGIVNADDHYHEAFMNATAQQVVTYGIDSDADVTATNIELSAKGTSFVLRTPQGSVDIESSLIGKFSVYNMLAAATGAWMAGVPLATIQQAFHTTEGIRGRFEPVLAGQEYGVIVDYAHTPDSLENVLTTVKNFAEGNVYVVVGCGGDRDRTKRPLMAKVAVEYADVAIFTSDNPRTEQPAAILQDMEEGVDVGSYKTIEDRREAIGYAIQHASKDDVVLIAGKGHETYQIVGEEVKHFDDVEVAREHILANK
ncbi:UDP-N-acetylmuramoylalanyl-D-glutamate--2,6-diaminopimelate ligase [Pontibacillus halophilus JSM 076056 = DSM 19796]|uniref:UDP-N-acetylmuramoyl-L-alanyl-D-glutamate--2,6-diaminopimelate ligase n=1 Tax=Pontibacillus halophilus JSM 076056 = DSM 19796 TaxID=1385510 RepID=A0A0A5GQ13_9BACI|nr:UDP-N-acetylmuramoyl-L-alanyl-D-glutamate--2,6-diaminopimelate ligase [Pontibacillus halophilus]KGX93265.1 UDP-N-acetylmuramoylalanyl-D-glutamate--2,6-diaminopimelate ligase [Pontibacillus halophilus JSM 076056 = DSM 19796]